MSVPKSIKHYLSDNGLNYVCKKHPVAYTSMETAAIDHVPGRDFAKSVMLKADGGLIMAVLPADHVINMRELKRKIGAKTLTLAAERDFADLFPECDAGAMPPFGRFYGLKTYCDRPLAEELEIEFNAGTHEDVICMDFADFYRLEAPTVLDFSDKFTGRRMPRAA